MTRTFKPKTDAARINDLNKTRAHWGELAVARMAGSNPGPFGDICYEPEHLVDLPTDLMHLCDRRARLDFEVALAIARAHFNAEVQR